MWNFIKKHKLFVSTLFTVVILVSVLGVQFDVVPQNGSPTIGQGQVVLRIGTAEASGTVDYICDGTDDDIQFNGALAALPPNGGELLILAGNYDTNAIVTAVKDNVTIRGVGRGTYITRGGGLPVFTAGGNNWTFSDLRTDAGSIDMLATTGWSWENVTINATYYAYRTDDATTSASWNIPTGRTATYVIAASDAPAHVKAQADYACTGVGATDATYINALISAAPTYGLSIYFTNGTYTDIPLVIAKDYITLRGAGMGHPSAGGEAGIGGTIFLYTGAVNAITLGVVAPTRLRGIEISGMTISGSGVGNGKTAILNDFATQGVIDQPYIHDMQINNYGTAIKLYSDAGHFDHISLLFNGTGYDGTGSVYDKISNSEISDNTNFGVLACFRLENSTLVRNGTGVREVLQVVQNHIGGSITNGIINDASIFTLTLGGIIIGNYIDGNNGNTLASQTGVIISGNILKGSITWDGLNLFACDNCTITGNRFSGNNRYGLSTETGADNNVIIGNEFYTNGTANYYNIASVNNLVEKNIGYIASGEIRTASGTLTAGNANAIGFAWHNLELQDIYIKKVVVTVTTGGGTVGSHLDVGIADDATYTNGGTEFFNDLLLNNVQVNDSTNAADGGNQTKWVFCQDSVSATDGWVVGKILDANAASLVGSYYIEYVGR